MMDKRPELNNKISLNDFKDFYWLKEELIDFCREEGLKRGGGKIEIAKRIEHYLRTGEQKITAKSKSKESKFDWNREILSLNTMITDSYKNSEQVRIFFKKQIGDRFKFNVKFMNWIKANEGKTLKDAIAQWKQFERERKSNKEPKEIQPQFEYNKYLRDFLADNPGKSRKVGIELWKIKRSMRGDNIYQKSDLNWVK